MRILTFLQFLMEERKPKAWTNHWVWCFIFQRVWECFSKFLKLWQKVSISKLIHFQTQQWNLWLQRWFLWVFMSQIAWDWVPKWFPRWQAESLCRVRFAGPKDWSKECERQPMRTKNFFFRFFSFISVQLNRCLQRLVWLF